MFAADKPAARGSLRALTNLRHAELNQRGCKIKVHSFIHSAGVQIFIAACTLFALFGADIRLGFFDINVDATFEITTTGMCCSQPPLLYSI